MTMTKPIIYMGKEVKMTMTKTKPTEELERLFGSKWPDVIDKFTQKDPITITYREKGEVVGFSYRHDTLCLYVGINGERKTIPLSDILSINTTASTDKSILSPLCLMWPPRCQTS